MAELEPLKRRTLLLRAGGLVLLYGVTAIAMGAGLFVLVHVFDGSFRDLQLPRSEPAPGQVGPSRR